jgi:hypothetical protein
VAGSYGPSDPQPSSGNPADPSDPRPHITRSSGGAGVEGTYGPDSTIKSSQQEGPAQHQQQDSKGASSGCPEQKAQATTAAGSAEDSAMPDPMVAADDGSHNMQPRSKL